MNEFREQTRMLVRKLGLLSQVSCCYNVSMAECHCLVEIGRYSNLTLKELAKLLDLETSLASKTVDSLVKKGYVLRVPSVTDRRYINLNLSEEGKVQFNNIESDMNRKYNQIFDKASDEEKEILIKGLIIYNKILEKE